MSTHTHAHIYLYRCLIELHLFAMNLQIRWDGKVRGAGFSRQRDKECALVCCIAACRSAAGAVRLYAGICKQSQLQQWRRVHLVTWTCDIQHLAPNSDFGGKSTSPSGNMYSTSLLLICPCEPNILAYFHAALPPLYILCPLT